MLSAEIVSIGTELLLGQITDTDAPFLSRRLSALGIGVYHRTTVGDNYERALATVLQALSRADVVLLIGGLGPTMDDLTRDIMAAATDSPLVRDSFVKASRASPIGTASRISLAATVPGSPVASRLSTA